LKALDHPARDQQAISISDAEEIHLDHGQLRKALARLRHAGPQQPGFANASPPSGVWLGIMDSENPGSVGLTIRKPAEKERQFTLSPEKGLGYPLTLHRTTPSP
jgi:hypothetical protein